MIGAAAESARATLLIVDDVTANLRLVVEYLESHGFRVIVAQEGAEALRRAHRVVPDLILLDVRMPGLDGFEICRRLKAEPRTRGIPVIFMTALTDTHDKLAGFAAGAADYITKPLHMEELRARVSAHVRVRALQIQLESQNAKLLAANQALEAFTYSASHDLRAPLRSITGFAQVLRDEHAAVLNKDARACIDRIIENSARMMSLIDELLRYARTGAAAVRSEPVALEAVVEQVIVALTQRIDTARAQIDIVRPLATPRGDPTLVGQILQNLIENALTYRRPNVTPQIRVSAVRHDMEVIMHVTDNGIGIEPQYHDQIFEVFQRLHSSSEYPGTGIGLAIVEKAARLMGGSVGLDSLPGQGSTFSVHLPAAEESGSAAR